MTKRCSLLHLDDINSLYLLYTLHPTPYASLIHAPRQIGVHTACTPSPPPPHPTHAYTVR
eukprot:2951832-Rhodomonas_salina.1